MSLSDSALSQRRQQLGADIFLLIMRETLRPLADEHLHPACFHRGLRLVGIDGTRWNVANTPQQAARLTKAKTRRGSAAFAQIHMSALVELGTHAPLHATLGIDFNNDGSLFDPMDIDAFLSVYSEGPCVPDTATCDDIDFNNDTSVFDPCDIDSFLLVYSEGPCTPCGV